MALGELTRQLAGQAIESALGPSTPAQPEGVGSVIATQIQAMQKALKEEDELAVSFWTGSETIRVFEIFAPVWDVFILTGADSIRGLTRVVSPAASTQLVCKIQRVAPAAKPIRVNFKLPKS